MDGVDAVRAVLLADAELAALVPNVVKNGVPWSQIIAGPLGLNFTLPAISLESISKVDRNIPAPGNRRHVRERVQVTVHAKNYPEQKAILRAVRHAAADKLNSAVTGLTAVTIHTESAGPDFMSEDASIWLGSQDFMVTYTEER